MLSFSRNDMADEIDMVRHLQEQARSVAAADWAAWVNRHKDMVRLSGKDDYVPDQEEWIKRCESFLACAAGAFSMPTMKHPEPPASAAEEPRRTPDAPRSE